MLFAAFSTEGKYCFCSFMVAGHGNTPVQQGTDLMGGSDFMIL